MPAAEKFADWVTHEVLPSIRKYGYYKINEEHKAILDKINAKLKRLKNAKKHVDEENIRLKRDLKKEIFPKGGLVYAIDYSTNKKEAYKIGMTEDMNKRKEIYNSHTINKQPVAFYTETKCPRSLEWCIRGLLYDFRYKNRKDFYVCSLKRVKLAFKSCTCGSKKVNYSKKSGSKTNNKIQKGGSFSIYDSKIITKEITKTMTEHNKIKSKISTLNKKIYD